MSRLPSFFTVSSGNAQLLQNVLIPVACNTSRNNQAYWGAKADLCNIGTLRAETIIATNFSGGQAGVIGDRNTGVAIAGDGSDVGTYATPVSQRNIAGFGTNVLGGQGSSNTPHGTISNVVAIGPSCLDGACNITDSVFIGHLAGYLASDSRNIVAIGEQAGYLASDSCNIVAIGDLAGYRERGSNNVYIGTQSGSANQGSGNVFLGSLVGSTDIATSNRLYIGNSSSTPYLIQGNFSNRRVGINRDPETNFDVSGETRLRGNVIIDGDLTVSGGPIGSDVCTGQVVLGIGVSSPDYPSLISVKGGIQLSDGFIQLNRTDGRDPLYRLDVSASARITGGSLIGGVSLSGTNLTTTGNVTISGAFSNLSTTSNTIGGITLGSSSGVDRIRLTASGANGGGEIKLFNGLSTVSDTVAIFGRSVGNAGAIYISSLSAGSSNGRIAGMRMDDDENGGYFFLTNLSGNSTVQLYGSGDVSSGQILVRNGAGTQTIGLNGGADGGAPGSGYFALSNANGQRTFEILGGLGDVTLFSNGTPTFDVDGATGRVSNSPSSSNTIGGITLDKSIVTDLSKVLLRASGLYGRGEFGHDGSGGYLKLNDSTYGFTQVEALTSPTETQFNIYGPNDTARNGSIRMFGSSGRISNLASSSNSIGGVTMGSLLGTNRVRITGCNTTIDNGGSVQLYNSNSSNVVSINAAGGGGFLEVKNSTGITVASINGVTGGGIVNSNTSSNFIGGVVLSNYEVTINLVTESVTGNGNGSNSLSMVGKPTGIYIATIYFTTGCNVRGGSMSAPIIWDNISAIGGGSMDDTFGNQTTSIFSSNAFVVGTASSNWTMVVQRILRRYDALP